MGVEIRLDSELLANQLSGHYRIDEDKLKLLFVDVWNLRLDFGSVLFSYIPREKNKQADRLLNQALNQESQKLL